MVEVRRPSGPEPRNHRLVGLDVARCLALLGMMAVHLHERLTPAGDISPVYLVAGGRASALFAVLAGVSMALMTGRTVPVHGAGRARLTAALAARALLVAFVGLVLAELDSGLAIILTFYGVLFLLGLPFLGFRAPELFLWAGVSAVAAPVAAQLLRPALPPRPVGSPDLARLADPVRLLGELLLTGYYPALTWLPFLLLGLAIGRLDLQRTRVVLRLLLGGVAAAVAAVTASWWLLGRPWFREALLPGASASTREEALQALGERFVLGTPPVGAGWEWLLVAMPHTATPADLLHAGGTAAAVIGACVLVVRALPRVAERAVAVLFGAGTMTFTLYSLHVFLRSPHSGLPDQPESYLWHVLIVMAIGALAVAARRRGPLEYLAALPLQWARGR